MSMSADDKEWLAQLSRHASGFTACVDSQMKLNLKWRADVMAEIDAIVEHAEQLMEIADEASGLRDVQRRAG